MIGHIARQRGGIRSIIGPAAGQAGLAVRLAVLL